MTVGEACCRDVVFVREDERVIEAARLMMRFRVGDVVVVREEEGVRYPVGILTDRDIVVRVVAASRDPRVASVGEVASRDLLALHEGVGLSEGLDRLRERGVRRAPVVGSDGELVGVLSADDVADVLAEELTSLARVLTGRGRRHPV